MLPEDSSWYSGHFSVGLRGHWSALVCDTKPVLHHAQSVSYLSLALAPARVQWSMFVTCCRPFSQTLKSSTFEGKRCLVDSSHRHEADVVLSCRLAQWEDAIPSTEAAITEEMICIPACLCSDKFAVLVPANAGTSRLRRLCSPALLLQKGFFSKW